MLVHMSATTPEVDAFARLFKVLADATRLRIVALLAHGELCVCHIEDALALSQPKVSRHLGSLRGQVVTHRRAGAWVYYRLTRHTDADCERHLRLLVKSFAKHDLLRQDLARLVTRRGPRACK